MLSLISCLKAVASSGPDTGREMKDEEAERLPILICILVVMGDMLYVEGEVIETASLVQMDRVHVCHGSGNVKQSERSSCLEQS